MTWCVYPRRAIMRGRDAWQGGKERQGGRECVFKEGGREGVFRKGGNVEGGREGRSEATTGHRVIKRRQAGGNVCVRASALYWRGTYQA